MPIEPWSMLKGLMQEEFIKSILLMLAYRPGTVFISKGMPRAMMDFE
jgi:hypothetical protein